MKRESEYNFYAHEERKRKMVKHDNEEDNNSDEQNGIHRS